MNDQLTLEGSDALLGPFLEATDQTVAEHLLATLIQEHADPIIEKILKSKLRVSLTDSHGSRENQDALEIASQVRITLINDLRAVQQRQDKKSITSFPDYVAVKTYSACADYFRERNPQRRRLKNLLRYQLRQNQRFALWKAGNNIWYAGFSEWRNFSSLSNSLPAVDAILARYATKPAAQVSAAELLSAVFECTGQPVRFEQLLNLAAEFWDLNPTQRPVELSDRELERELAGTAPGVDLLLEQRLYVEQLWTEVCQLPVLQRAALLLNLRDAHGGSALFFIPHLGIASQSQIAEILELPQETFSMLWNELPWDDARIAKQLGITRQQVINLRKTARERLARRMEKTTNKNSLDAGDSKKRR